MADMMTNFTAADMLGTKEHAARKARPAAKKIEAPKVAVKAPVEAAQEGSKTQKTRPTAKTSGAKK